MSSLHIIGFGSEPKLSLRYRWKWHPSYPDEILEIERGDAVILNLIEVNTAKTVEQVSGIVAQMGQNGGVLVVVSVPIRYVSKDVTNYHFLPWSDDTIRTIQNRIGHSIRAVQTAPSWVHEFYNHLYEEMISPVCFPYTPGEAYSLMSSPRCGCVCLNYKHNMGRILIFPPIKSMLHGESGSSAKNALANYLDRLTRFVLNRFEELSEPHPEWLDSIMVQDESQLREQYECLSNKLDRLYEEKSILAESGYTLTRKIASLLELIGFQTEEKEIQGIQDIEISDGEFAALVECSGRRGNFSIHKLRQLIDYLIDKEGSKGIFIGNPWRDLHPKDRDLSNAFTDGAKRRAESLGICLVTVPDLYRAYLDSHIDGERTAIRESLKNCNGLWQCRTSDW